MKGIFFIVLLVPLLLKAQSGNSIKEKSDSIFQVIRMVKNDTVLIRSYQVIHELVKGSDFDQDQLVNKLIDSICSDKLKQKLSKKVYAYYSERKTYSLNNMGEVCLNRGDYEKAEWYFKQAYQTALKTNYGRGIANYFTNMGVVLYYNTKYDEATKFLNKGLKWSRKLKDKKLESINLTSIGNVYSDQGQFAKAVNYHSAALKIAEQIKDETGVARIFMNIGNIHAAQQNYDQAIEYFSKSLKLYEHSENKSGVANLSLNMGNVFATLGDDKKAMKYYLISLSKIEELGDKYAMAVVLNNIGGIYYNSQDFNKSMEYYQKSLQLLRLVDDKWALSSTLQGIADVYKMKGDLKKSNEYYKEALAIVQEIGILPQVRELAYALWELNKKMGNNKVALEMFELHVQARDSVNSEENQKEVMRQQYKYEYEKQSAADSIKNLEEKKVRDAFIAQQKAELRAKWNQQILLFGGLTLVIVFSIFIFYRFRITSKQKVIIELQKAEVEEKNKEITDSINYARRIQAAILPPAKLIQEFIPNAFIVYKPKDIVAGDFYWLQKSGNTILFAACDCTGHGVPGAMVSVVCNNGLNRAVKEFRLSEPGLILDKTRELVIQEFEKSEEEVKDGMDISLIALEYSTTQNGNRETSHEQVNNGNIDSRDNDLIGTTLRWAGANNPLWICRQGEILEFKANKQPIGKYEGAKPFTTHKVELKKDDTLYFFTDGFQDQFGGEKGKKFKASKLKELLLSIQEKSMPEQKALLEKEFLTWKGDLEQNDDVCLIGVRV